MAKIDYSGGLFVFPNLLWYLCECFTQYLLSFDHLGEQQRLISSEPCVHSLILFFVVFIIQYLRAGFRPPPRPRRGRGYA